MERPVQVERVTENGNSAVVQEEKKRLKKLQREKKVKLRVQKAIQNAFHKRKLKDSQATPTSLSWGHVFEKGELLVQKGTHDVEVSSNSNKKEDLVAGEDNDFCKENVNVNILSSRSLANSKDQGPSTSLTGHALCSSAELSAESPSQKEGPDLVKRDFEDTNDVVVTTRDRESSPSVTSSLPVSTLEHDHENRKSSIDCRQKEENAKVVRHRVDTKCIDTNQNTISEHQVEAVGSEWPDGGVHNIEKGHKDEVEGGNTLETLGERVPTVCGRPLNGSVQYTSPEGSVSEGSKARNGEGKNIVDSKQAQETEPGGKPATVSPSREAHSAFEELERRKRSSEIRKRLLKSVLQGRSRESIRARAPETGESTRNGITLAPTDLKHNIPVLNKARVKPEDRTSGAHDSEPPLKESEVEEASEGQLVDRLTLKPSSTHNQLYPSSSKNGRSSMGEVSSTVVGNTGAHPAPSTHKPGQGFALGAAQEGCAAPPSVAISDCATVIGQSLAGMGDETERVHSSRPATVDPSAFSDLDKDLRMVENAKDSSMLKQSYSAQVVCADSLGICEVQESLKLTGTKQSKVTSERAVSSGKRLTVLPAVKVGLSSSRLDTANCVNSGSDVQSKEHNASVGQSESRVTFRMPRDTDKVRKWEPRGTPAGTPTSVNTIGRYDSPQAGRSILKQSREDSLIETPTGTPRSRARKRLSLSKEQRIKQRVKKAVSKAFRKNEDRREERLMNTPAPQDSVVDQRPVETKVEATSNQGDVGPPQPQAVAASQVVERSPTMAAEMSREEVETSGEAILSPTQRSSDRQPSLTSPRASVYSPTNFPSPPPPTFLSTKSRDSASRVASPSPKPVNQSNDFGNIKENTTQEMEKTIDSAAQHKQASERETGGEGTLASQWPSRASVIRKIEVKTAVRSPERREVEESFKQHGNPLHKKVEGGDGARASGSTSTLRPRGASESLPATENSRTSLDESKATRTPSSSRKRARTMSSSSLAAEDAVAGGRMVTRHSAKANRKQLRSRTKEEVESLRKKIHDGDFIYEPSLLKSTMPKWKKQLFVEELKKQEAPGNRAGPVQSSELPPKAPLLTKRKRTKKTVAKKADKQSVQSESDNSVSTTNKITKSGNKIEGQICSGASDDRKKNEPSSELKEIVATPEQQEEEKQDGVNVEEGSGRTDRADESRTPRPSVEKKSLFEDGSVRRNTELEQTMEVGPTVPEDTTSRIPGGREEGSSVKPSMDSGRDSVAKLRPLNSVKQHAIGEQKKEKGTNSESVEAVMKQSTANSVQTQFSRMKRKLGTVASPVDTPRRSRRTTARLRKTEASTGRKEEETSCIKKKLEDRTNTAVGIKQERQKTRAERISRTSLAARASRKTQAVKSESSDTLEAAQTLLSDKRVVEGPEIPSDDVSKKNLVFDCDTHPRQRNLMAEPATEPKNTFSLIVKSKMNRRKGLRFNWEWSPISPHSGAPISHEDVEAHVELDRGLHQQLVFSQYRRHFRQWRSVLREGSSLLFYGFGSKKFLIEKFVNNCPVDGPLMVVPGYKSDASQIVRQLLLRLASQYSIDLEGASSILQKCERISKHWNARNKGQRLYLLVHNVDGTSLRTPGTQYGLSLLASTSNIHVIASVDHVNSRLLWNQMTSSNFNWFAAHTDTFLPYLDEVKYQWPASKFSKKEVNLSGLRFILESLTPNHRMVLRLVGEMGSKEDVGAEGGVEFQELYVRCRDEMIISNDQILKTYLNELLDHKLVKSVRGCDGIENFVMSVSMENLLKVVEEDQVG